LLDANNKKYKETSKRDERTKHFFNHSHEGLIFHINGIISDANPTIAEIIGFTTDELIGTSVLQWIAPRHHELIKQKIANPSKNNYEISLIHKSGEEIPVYIHPVQELTVGDQHERLVAIQEIRELKQLLQTQRQIEKKIHILSNFDPHTGLPNRHLFNHWLKEMSDRHHEEQQRFAIVHITIERMKMLNEIFGRNIVDQLLKQWTKRLCDILHETSTHRSARIGGIRFAIALPYIENTKSVVYLLQKIREKLEAPYQIGGHQIDNLTDSYGIAFFPDNGNDVETLMSHAEIACRHAREHESDSISCFSQEMNVHTLDNFKFEMRLKGALDRDEMTLYYQPQVDAITEQVIGYEALIRWQDPEQGLILPTEFIPLAEETGLIIPIGEWVIWEACQQLAQLQEIPGNSQKISINLSIRQFKQSNLVEIVRQALTLFEINPRLLNLELTESTVMDDVETSVNILNRLKTLGITISIDDFGTGYSSLSYLKRFPIDTLKIDRSFITDLTSNTHDKSIARAIITLAHSLHIKTVAEGVESQKQLKILREMKCDLIQGYLFGKPLPAERAFTT